MVLVALHKARLQSHLLRLARNEMQQLKIIHQLTLRLYPQRLTEILGEGFTLDENKQPILVK